MVKVNRFAAPTAWWVVSLCHRLATGGSLLMDCTMMTVCCIMSASRRRSRRATPRAHKKIRGIEKEPGFTGNAPEVRAAEHGTQRPSGNRSIRRTWWRSPTITLRRPFSPWHEDLRWRKDKIAAAMTMEQVSIAKEVACAPVVASISQLSSELPYAPGSTRSDFTS